MSKDMSHECLVRLAAAWLRRSKNCIAMFEDLKGNSGERPDIFGVTVTGTSIVVEVKSTRADAKNNIVKRCHRNDGGGLGDERWLAMSARTFATVPDNERRIWDGWGIVTFESERSSSWDCVRLPAKRDLSLGRIDNERAFLAIRIEELKARKVREARLIEAALRLAPMKWTPLDNDERYAAANEMEAAANEVTWHRRPKVTWNGIPIGRRSRVRA